MIEAFATKVTWIVYGIYCFGLIPQIILNYKHKSTSGLSDLMLLGYTGGYLSQFYYVFDGNHFPLSYKVLVPLSTVFVGIMVYQRFTYNSHTVTPLLKKTYGSLLVFVLFFTPIYLMYNLKVGLFFGWMSTSIWFVYQWPQIIKIHKQKSFKGFSLVFIVLMATAVSLELVSALILDLPNPTVVSNIRAIIVYSIFLVQFMMYRHRSV